MGVSWAVVTAVTSSSAGLQAAQISRDSRLVLTAMQVYDFRLEGSLPIRKAVLVVTSVLYPREAAVWCK
jgi:hypothetical protein